MDSFLNQKYITNPSWVFRQEFDDWAILFELDSGDTRTMNPTGAFIWQKLDGERSPEDLLNLLKSECDDPLPTEAANQLKNFLTELKKDGLIGYK